MLVVTAALAATHHLAIDQGSTAIDLVHGLRDQWVAVRPVVAPARDEPDAHGIAPRHEPKTIVLIW